MFRYWQVHHPPPSDYPITQTPKFTQTLDFRDTLLHGGNAVDAAIATLFCIGVMDTQSAGLGGGHFMTIYNATTKTCHVVDAREVAPLAAFEDMYKDKWNNSKYGWEAIAVPGELHGLWTEYKRFGGKIAWKNLIQPTIDILKDGKEICIFENSKIENRKPK